MSFYIPRHSRARTKLLVNSRNKGRSEEKEGPTGKMETGRHQVGSSSLKKKMTAAGLPTIGTREGEGKKERERGKAP